MRLLSIILVYLAFLPLAKAQQAPGVRSERETIEVLLSNESAIDSIVDLAIANSYFINGYKAELLQQYENVRQEKTKWVSTFRMGINFFSVNTSTNNLDQSVTKVGVLPSLGFTLTVDPEKFVNRGSYIREAKFNVVRAENQVYHQRRMLRGEIIGIYYQYLEALGIIELRESAGQNQAQQCFLLEEKFKKGEGRLEDLLNNQAALSVARESLLRAQLSAKKLKLEITILITDSEKYFASHQLANSYGESR